MSRSAFDYDVIVIGSGAAGSAAAVIAAKAGKRVAIIEADAFGGEAANYGDVPVASLLAAAHLYDEVRGAGPRGLRGAAVGFNYPSLRSFKEQAAKRAGGSRRYYQAQGIATYEGSAHFLTPNEISVNRRHLSGQYFLIATGASWGPSGAHRLAAGEYLTPRALLERPRPPKNLLVVGSTPEAVELAELMAILGSKVTIVESAPRLLPQFEPEVSEMLTSQFTARGITCLSETRVVSVAKEGNEKKVIITRGGADKSLRVDEIVVADQRMPRTDLGLENATVAYAPTGIRVNAQLQTSARHIYAAGSVAHPEVATHDALLEGRTAVHNILNAEKLAPYPVGSPRIVATQPEIAMIGLSEAQWHARRAHVRVTTVPLSAVPRAHIGHKLEGFVKLIANKDGTIVGGTIVGPNAGELVHELALAVRHGLTARQIAETPHAFLSESEAIRLAASELS